MNVALPREYAGWQELEPVFRRLRTPELIEEIQDGGPERRLAALAVIDLADVPLEVVAEWIRALPDVEANELAAAMPVGRLIGSCDEDTCWALLTRAAYDLRRLPAFLAAHFVALEMLEGRRCREAALRWQETAAWLELITAEAIRRADMETLADLTCLAFEPHVSRPPFFAAMERLLRRHRLLALHVSRNPRNLLQGLSPDRRTLLLRAAEAGGGLPAAEAAQLL